MVGLGRFGFVIIKAYRTMAERTSKGRAGWKKCGSGGSGEEWGEWGGVGGAGEVGGVGGRKAMYETLGIVLLFWPRKDGSYS